MEKKLIAKKMKLFIWVLFILYLVILINVILLKGGIVVDMVRMRSQYGGIQSSFTERISAINFIPFKTIIYYLSQNEGFGISRDNILGNIFAFTPLGFLLPILFDKCNNVRKILIIGLTVSLSIEVVQVVFSLGSGDIDDIILNVFGTILGFWIYIKFNKRLKNLLRRICDV